MDDESFNKLLDRQINLHTQRLINMPLNSQYHDDRLSVAAKAKALNELRGYLQSVVRSSK
ncbi:MAG: hypothetical protein HRT36_02680 [Alphaproteobacteria bacterium]|nr:hypothetical protein [Alphaproteobacteria bacterium]